MKRIGLVIVLLAVAAGAWEWTSPRRSAEGLRAAAMDGDTAALRKLVDFEAVRENLRADAKTKLEGLAGESPGALASVGLAMGDALVEQAIDALVSPAGVANLAGGAIDAEAGLEIERTGLNSFLARFGQSDGLSTPLEFRRHGVGWRLAHIRIESLPSAY